MVGYSPFFFLILCLGVSFIEAVHSFIPRASTNGKLKYVKDSGICETVPGVGQYSGYIDVGNENYFVRHLHPLALTMIYHVLDASGSGSSNPGAILVPIHLSYGTLSDKPALLLAFNVSSGLTEARAVPL